MEKHETSATPKISVDIAENNDTKSADSPSILSNNELANYEPIASTNKAHGPQYANYGPVVSTNKTHSSTR